jgi:radical SAM protein with 4Fe4S-binding SPASM domain
MSEAYFIFELTTHCNLDCIYCYNVWKHQDSFQRKDLTVAEIQFITEQLKKEILIKGITLAGGEPLLNEHLSEIASFLRSENIPLILATNGVLLTEEKISQLIDCGINHFEISMPATDHATYEKLCQSTLLKNVRKAMLNVKKHNAKLTVTAIISSQNYKQIFDIIELASAFGADYFALNRFVPGGEGLKHLKELNPSNDQLTLALQQADKAAGIHKIPVVVAIPVEHCLIKTTDLKKLKFGSCVCGDMKWVIDPYGNLRSCEQNPEILGNLFKENFNELKQKVAVEVFRKNNLHQDCSSKSCYTNCGGGCRFCRE